MLRDTIRQNFLATVKAKDKPKAEALRGLEVALKQVEVDTRKPLSDEDVVKILRGELKKREESIEIYTKANRPELASKEQLEADTIKEYLPSQMSKEEIVKIVSDVKSQLGEGANFGQVMQATMQAVAGKADGKLVSEVVKELFS